MAVTRLDWDIIASGSSSNLVNLQWITGKVRAGDAHTVLNELGRRFNNEVERITKAHSWGYAKRAVRGAAVASEHSAGTAVDFNAPKHGLGAVGTFSNAQEKAIRNILADLDGVVRWGGDYPGRKDEMHFELIGGAAKLKTAANKIRGNVTPVASKPSVKPKPSPATPAGKTVAQMAEEVIQGKHGNGHDNRRKSLGVSASVYEQVRDAVNGKAATKTVSQMATEVIQGKHGNGHPARQKSLGVTNAVYAKVRAEVNRRA